MMKFCGESENTIARALSIDPDTLRKHFVDELADGHAQRRKEVIGLLFQSARNGNVSAQKKLEEMGRAAGAAEAVKAREPKAPQLGKKDERQAAAQAVAAGQSKFAPPAPPRLVVNN
jgi:predicted RNA-binding Zn ribbon-like protein